MKALFRRPGLWLAAVSAVLCAALTALWALSGRGLASQTAAGRWQREQPFAQVSVFFSTDAAFDYNGVLGLRGQVDAALAAADLAPASAGSGWTDAWSAQTACDVSAGGNSRQARAICTGGDFFVFHPPDMASGWYYDGSELSDTLVVLDEPLAWQLFGSADVAGMTVTVGGWPCTVAGVARAPRQADESAAYGTDGTVYMSYSLCVRLWPGTAVTCYEALLPEAVSGFALQTVAGAVSAPESERYVVQNTGRFALGRCLAGLSQLPARVQRTDRVWYPYWENAARAAETRAALFAGLAAAAAAWPCLYGGFWAVRGALAGTRRLKGVIRRRAR